MTTPRRGLGGLDVIFALAAALVLAALVLPTLAAARGRTRGAASADNLRMLGAAHLVYAADWNGRQLTFVDDRISTYGSSVATAFNRYWTEHGGFGERTEHPPVALGWGQLFPEEDRYAWLAYRTGSNSANAALTTPIVFTDPSNIEFLGSFRLHNAVQFHQYLNGRFYDRVFYAPADTVVNDAVGEGFDVPDQYWRFVNVSNARGDIPAWSSYALSAAAMFAPAVMAHDDPDDGAFNGWVDPWSFDDAFTSPGYFHAAYPALKTHMLEHHWLQDAPADCNPAFGDQGTYGDDGCEPYYFNHGFDSRPVTLFYDGHVAELPVLEAILADAQVREQQNPNWGLWSQDTPFGTDGYLSDLGYDGARTSFHVLTTDGIRGRDVTATALGAPRGERRGDDHPALRRRGLGPKPVDARAPRFSFTGD